MFVTLKRVIVWTVPGTATRRSGSNGKTPPMRTLLPGIGKALHALLAAGLMAWAGNAAADAIRVDGTWQHDVYIEASERMFYVLVPKTGTVRNISKAEVDAEDVVITEDAAARRALRARWKAQNQARKTDRTLQAELPSHTTTNNEKPAPTRKTARHEQDASASDPAPDDHPTDGVVHQIRLDNVEAGVALQAIARSLGLDYQDVGTHVLVSTPQRRRTETPEPVEPYVQHLRGPARTALPKIIVRNPSGALAAGGGGMRGGYGAAGGGGGMRGGYGAAGGGDVTAIGNISDLFSTIDDRMVGEAPAPIPGLQLRPHSR